MNVAKVTEKYIQEHPYVRNCLKKGLINYSSLSRIIGEKEKIKNFDAILIACRRYRDKIKKDKYEKEILELLSKSKIEVKNKIMVVVLEKNTPNIEILEKKVRKDQEIFRLIEGATAKTLIVSNEYNEDVKKLFKTNILKENHNLVEITIKSPPDIESTPGVISLLYSLFSESGINIVETMSCWIDTIFIVEDKDLAKVMEILRF